MAVVAAVVDEDGMGELEEPQHLHTIAATAVLGEQMVTLLVQVQVELEKIQYLITRALMRTVPLFGFGVVR